MKITIIGAGAMGSLFGSLLADSGQDVLLIDIWQAHIDAVNARGVCIESGEKTRWIAVKASSHIQDGKNSDLVIVFVKSTQTGPAADAALACLNGTGHVLTLQNGMGNADVISEVVPPDRVVAGTTSHGATLLGPGRIRHAGTGPTLIGLWSKKSSAGLEPIKRVLCDAGLDTSIEADIHRVIWKKLIINIGINAITALTGIKNGGIADHPPTGDLVRAAVKEACDVAAAHHVTLADDIIDQVFSVARATGSNRSSMGQDVDHQRQTEIDTINGAVVKLAEAKEIPVPVNRTLTALVKTLEKSYRLEKSYIQGEK